MTLGVGVVGAGYWGPNLVRNFRDSPDWELVAVCDLDAERARRVVGDGRADVMTDIEALLARKDVDAVAIATPASTHLHLALAALQAGKHVVVEKPIATSTAEAKLMLAAALDAGLVLMCDHTYCYTPVVQRIRDIIGSGELGDVLFVDSVRINLGLVQPDVDVLWDLAPHDLSILDFVLPGGLRPEAVAAHGADPIGAGRACVGYLTMPLPGGAIAHVSVNWLSPTKIRQMVVGGSRRTLVWDDLNPQQRLSVYDRGIDLDLSSRTEDLDDRRTAGISYRLGDMHAPSLPETEALGGMVGEFAAAIRGRRAPLTDGSGGLRVLSVLESATTSLEPRWSDGQDLRQPTVDRADGGLRMSDLSGADILVTGGAGTIGSTLVDQLLDAGAARVDVLDNLVRGRRENLEDALATGRARLVEGDLADRDLVNDLTAGRDLVFHQAAIRITQCAEDPRLALEVLVDGTFNVIEAAADHRVDKLVLASSASVYGLAEQFPTGERHHHHNNDTFYGAAKSFNEGMARSFRAMRGLDYVALRYFNVYGPRMDVHGLYTEVLVRWMERIADGEPPLIFGDGAQTMDFVYTGDIARANVLAAASDVTEGVYNIASGTETSLLGLAESLLRAMDSDLHVEHGPERAVNGVTRRLADVTAAQRDLGWVATTDLENGLRKLVEWWQPLREAVAAGRSLSA